MVTRHKTTGDFSMETAGMLQLLGSAERDSQWLDKNYSNLLEKYPDSFIAVYNGNFVDASPNFEELIEKIKNKKLDPVDVMIKFLSKVKRIF